MGARLRDLLRPLAYGGVRTLRRFRAEESLVLVSDPRGGSTWLAELLEESAGAAVVWEPLTIGRVPEVRDLGFTRRQYIPEDASWPEAERVMDRILTGRLLSPFICSHSGIGSFATARRLLVKFCRAQALLPWLTLRYAFRRRPVHMIRHPFAVAASQKAHGGWSWPGLRYAVVDGRFGEIYEEHRTYLDGLESFEESLVAIWCMGNLVPLRHPRRGRDWVTVTYEELLMEPERVLSRLFRELGLDLPARAVEEAAEPSRTTKDPSFLRSRSAQLEKWREAFSSDELRRMQTVLAHFGVTEYSGDDLMPRPADHLASRP